MRCPYCHQDNDRVTDTRTSDDGFVVRRRRICCACDKRYTTHERAEATEVRVIKRDGNRVLFDRNKLREGIERACWKRPISESQILTLVAEVEADIDSAFETEVESQFIGSRVMHYLYELDQVAYVRFASVYRRFTGAKDFAEEIDGMFRHSSDLSSFHAAPRPQKLRFPKAKKRAITDTPDDSEK
ncbi:MAG: transcriptional regulator NrdR [Thermoguttaceae bacterium]